MQWKLFLNDTSLGDLQVKPQVTMLSDSPGEPLEAKILQISALPVSYSGLLTSAFHELTPGDEARAARTQRVQPYMQGPVSLELEVSSCRGPFLPACKLCFDFLVEIGPLKQGCWQSAPLRVLSILLSVCSMSSPFRRVKGLGLSPAT